MLTWTLFSAGFILEFLTGILVDWDPLKSHSAPAMVNSFSYSLAIVEEVEHFWPLWHCLSKNSSSLPGLNQFATFGRDLTTTTLKRFWNLGNHLVFLGYHKKLCWYFQSCLKDLLDNCLSKFWKFNIPFFNAIKQGILLHKAVCFNTFRIIIF